MTKSIITIIGLLLLLPIAITANPYQPKRSFPFLEPWRPQNAPSNHSFRCIAESPDHTLWFGTSQGVLSYDGYHWREYPLGESAVEAICVTQNGTVYAGTDISLNKLDQQTGTWQRIIPTSPQSRAIPWKFTSLIETQNGHIYAGTTWGVLQIAGEHIRLYTSTDMKIGLEKADPSLFPALTFVPVPDHVIPEQSWFVAPNSKKGFGIRVVNYVDKFDPIVWSITPQGPGEKAGIQIRDQVIDILTAPNTKHPILQTTLDSLAYHHKKIQLHIQREGKSKWITITQPKLKHGFGINLLKQVGAIVWKLSPNGPGENAGLQIGDEITVLNGEPIPTQQRVNKYLRASKENYQVEKNKIIINRGHQKLNFTIEADKTTGSFREFAIYDVFEDKQQNLWFGISNKLEWTGVIRYTPKTNIWRLFTKQDGLNQNARFRPRFAQTSDNAIWAVSWDGYGDLSRFAPDLKIWKNNATNTPQDVQKKFQIHNSVQVRQDSTLWIGGNEHLHIYKGGDWKNPASWQTLNFENAPSQYFPLDKRYLDLLETSDNALWLILEGNNPIRLDHSTTYEGLNFELLSQNQTAWFLSDQEKVVKYDGQSWTAYDQTDGLISHPRRLIETQEGTIYAIGTHNDTVSIAKFNGNRWYRYNNPSLYANISPEAICESPNGKIWIGSLDPGQKQAGQFAYFHNNQWTNIPIGATDPHDIKYFLPNPKGSHLPANSLWFGGNRLRVYVDTGTDGKRVHVNDESLGEGFLGKIGGNSNHIDALFADTHYDSINKHGIWVSTRREGVYYFDGKSWIKQQELENVSSFFRNQKGILFAVTSGRIKFHNGQEWMEHTILSNLRERYKQSPKVQLGQSNAKEIWINNNFTIDKRTDVGNTINKEINLQNQKAFRTTQIRLDNDPPETAIIESLEEVPYPGNITFKWSAMDRWQMTPNNMLLYSWRLNKKDWSPYTAQTTVFFKSLSKGNYTFEVKSRDINFNEDPTPAVIEFTVMPAIWQQSWFLGTISLLIGTIAYLSVRVVKRGKALSQSNKALSDANQSLTQEITERERLDTQIQDLQYLYTLRATLAETKTTEETLQAVGQAAKELLSSDGGITITLDDQSYTFGQPTDASQQYERELHWGERLRGTFILYSPFTLSESQERTLLDETTGQLVRVLESRELQMQLLQSSRLISLGQMAAGVAHELNQPLGGISATAEDYYLRLQDNMPVSNDQLKELFKRVLGMVDRMSNTVEHLRIFSRDTSQEPGKPLHVNHVIHSSLDIIGTQLKNHGIEITLKLTEDLPQILGHPYQLEQIFLNLLGNARDALDARQESNEIFKTITISTQKDNDTIIAKVQDNGEGINAEHLNHIFEPFYTTKPADKGTGLGLSITYAIVKNHGGNITCTSTIYRGTTFEVTFPTMQSNTQGRAIYANHRCTPPNAHITRR